MSISPFHRFPVKTPAVFDLTLTQLSSNVNCSHLIFYPLSMKNARTERSNMELTTQVRRAASQRESLVWCGPALL